jgi:hypothetical protein
MLCVAALVLVGAAQAPPPGGPLRFERLNRPYEDIAPEIVPVVEGPITIRLSSPSNRMTVRDHRLRLEPGSSGSHSAELRVEFEGRGRLVADVDIAGLGGRFEDEVIVPAQAADLEGRVRVQKAAGGYLVTPEQLPPRVAVRIRSGLAGQIVGLCETAAQVPFTSLDCSGLNRRLSTALVPLPAPGESYLLEDADLSAEERRILDASLAPLARSPR